jgi:beta-N-acetylhexosaminidase
MARLDDSVRRQLAWKYELGLFKERVTSLDEIDRIVSNPDTVALTDEIATRAITLVRNEVLPLKSGQKVGVLGISNGFDMGVMNTLNSSLRSGGLRFDSVYLQENSLQAQLAAARKLVSESDFLIVGLYGRVRSGAKNSVGIPENGAAILREALAANKQVIAVSFGNPYLLGSFPEIKNYVVAYGDMPSLQRAAARAILGTQDITGRLPISLPGLHPRGTGIQLKKISASD